MICLSHLQFQCLWIQLPIGHPWQLPSRIHLNCHYCQNNMCIWQTLEKNDTHFLVRYCLTATRCSYKGMIKSVAVIINKELITFSILLTCTRLLSIQYAQVRMSLNLPEATKVSQKQRSCQTEQPQPIGEVPSELYNEMQDTGVLGDASQRCSAHDAINSTPTFKLHLRSLPYVVCFQKGVETCMAACSLQNLKFF